MLNDCKYGVSVEGGSLRLSLHKGGTHPDYKGDHDGIHTCVYSFLPHMGGFGAENVIRPAYELNVPALAVHGSKEIAAPVTVEAPNVIVETVKPCEDTQNAYIVRMYEAEGAYAETAVSVPAAARETQIVNMLEETQESLGGGRDFRLGFRPFEIKTLKVVY